MDGHGPGGPLHLSPLPGQLIELLAVDLNGGIHGGHLENVPGELGQHRLHLLGRYLHRVLLQSVAAGVLGVGDDPQLQPCHILLVPPLGKFHRPGGPAHKHGEDSGGHGVQGPGVSNPPLSQHPPQLGAHIHGCPVLGLVNDDNSVGHPVFLPGYLRFNSWSMACKMAALASSTLPMTVQPAAALCPPPPRWAHTAQASR